MSTRNYYFHEDTFTGEQLPRKASFIAFISNRCSVIFDATTCYTKKHNKGNKIANEEACMVMCFMCIRRQCPYLRKTWYQHTVLFSYAVDLWFCCPRLFILTWLMCCICLTDRRTLVIPLLLNIVKSGTKDSNAFVALCPVQRFAALENFCKMHLFARDFIRNVN